MQVASVSTAETAVSSNNEPSFRVVNGKMTIVRKPTPMELIGLQANFAIKPWSSGSERRRNASLVTGAKQSLFKAARRNNT